MSKDLLFGDIVVVDGDQIGVIVKSWEAPVNDQTKPATFELYVRSYNGIGTYPEGLVDRHRVRHKYLDEEELEYQNYE